MVFDGYCCLNLTINLNVDTVLSLKRPLCSFATSWEALHISSLLEMETSINWKMSWVPRFWEISADGCIFAVAFNAVFGKLICFCWSYGLKCQQCKGMAWNFQCWRCLNFYRKRVAYTWWQSILKWTDSREGLAGRYCVTLWACQAQVCCLGAFQVQVCILICHGGWLTQFTGIKIDWCWHFPLIFRTVRSSNWVINLFIDSRLIRKRFFSSFLWWKVVCKLCIWIHLFGWFANRFVTWLIRWFAHWFLRSNQMIHPNSTSINRAQACECMCIPFQKKKCQQH